MKARIRLLGATTVAVLALAGCSSGVEADARYDTLDAFKAAAEQSGLKCKGWTSMYEGDDSVMAGRCDNHVSLFVWPGGGTDLETVAIGLGFITVSEEFEPALLTASNWAVGGPEKHVKPLRRSLGGEFEDTAALMQDAFDEILKKK